MAEKDDVTENVTQREITPEKDIPNTSRPPGDWQGPEPEEMPEPSTGIVDPREETSGPGDISIDPNGVQSV